MAPKDGGRCRALEASIPSDPKGIAIQEGKKLLTETHQRPRSGKINFLQERVNDCLERSMKGKALSYNSPEMNCQRSFELNRMYSTARSRRAYSAMTSAEEHTGGASAPSG
jgi:hypothetical protein